MFQLAQTAAEGEEKREEEREEMKIKGEMRERDGQRFDIYLKGFSYLR